MSASRVEVVRRPAASTPCTIEPGDGPGRYRVRIDDGERRA